LDPARYPPPGFIANHTQTAWQVPVRFDPEATAVPDPVNWAYRAPLLRRPPTPSQHVLGPRTAGPWLEAVLEALVPETGALCSALAIRDWLIDEELAAATHLHRGADHYRQAALLTRHLGRTDELDPILARAQALDLKEKTDSVTGRY